MLNWMRNTNPALALRIIQPQEKNRQQLWHKYLVNQIYSLQSCETSLTLLFLTHIRFQRYWHIPISPLTWSLTQSSASDIRQKQTKFSKKVCPVVVVHSRWFTATVKSYLTYTGSLEESERRGTRKTSETVKTSEQDKTRYEREKLSLQIRHGGFWSLYKGVGSIF